MNVFISNSGLASKPFLDRISVVHGDIAAQDTDAIAIVIPKDLRFQGGINTSVQEAAGYDVEQFIHNHINKPKIGEVYALPADGLPTRHILVGVMPYYRTEFDMSESHLSGVTRGIMELARCMLLGSIAFAPIGSGKGNFPKVKAARLVCKGITDRMHENIEDIRIVCKDPQRTDVFKQKLEVLGWEG